MSSVKNLCELCVKINTRKINHKVHQEYTQRTQRKNPTYKPSETIDSQFRCYKTIVLHIPELPTKIQSTITLNTINSQLKYYQLSTVN